MSSTPALKRMVPAVVNEYGVPGNATATNISRNSENFTHMRRVYSVSGIDGKRVEPHRLSNSYSKQMYSFSKSSR